MQNVYVINKEIGETPLEALEKLRVKEGIDARIPMTYAGRLDPIAEGLLLILTGEECKNKEKYLGLDKEYEVEVLFGISTDTHDALGMIKRIDPEKPMEIDFSNYLGKFNQEYPLYSSKTVNGKQLHQYARSGEEIDEMPTKEVEIYSIDVLEERELSGKLIVEQSIEKIRKVTGDFRQEKIIAGWENFKEEYGENSFKILKIKVACSSGAYMRSLAHRIGKDAGTGALAFSIKRIHIGKYSF